MKKYWIGVLLLISMPAWAILPYAATPAEQAMCQARVYSRVDRSDPKRGGHMHHYCDGLRFIDRAYAAMGNKQDMGYYLAESIGNFNYVLKATPEDYAMRGEVHVGKARALKLAGRQGEAAAEYIKALRYNPNSSAIYLALADFYQGTGDKPKALEMVTEGLRRNLNSKGLKLRYTELGGKMPYPEPLVAKAAESESAQQTGSAPAPTIITPPISGTPASPASEQAKVPENKPPMGTPSNPYCRFCTD